MAEGQPEEHHCITASLRLTAKPTPAKFFFSHHLPPLPRLSRAPAPASGYHRLTYSVHNPPDQTGLPDPDRKSSHPNHHNHHLAPSPSGNISSTPPKPTLELETGRVSRLLNCVTGLDLETSKKKKYCRSSSAVEKAVTSPPQASSCVTAPRNVETSRNGGQRECREGQGRQVDAEYVFHRPFTSFFFLSTRLSPVCRVSRRKKVANGHVYSQRQAEASAV